MTVDVLFLTWNRSEFTEVALDCLERNTNWRLVNKLVIYDDGSDPEQLEKIVRCVPGTAQIKVPVDFRHTPRLGPVGAMLDYLRRDPSDVFVKIDNDIAVPELWLEDLSSVWGDVDLLGMEVGHPMGVGYNSPDPAQGRYFVPCRHIGGVGMMRTAAFLESTVLMRADGRNGFTEWQHTARPIRGWIFPEINAPCLDRLPIEPFLSLSAEYEQRKWQRPWWKYPLEADRYWSWMTRGEVPV